MSSQPQSSMGAASSEVPSPRDVAYLSRISDRRKNKIDDDFNINRMGNYSVKKNLDQQKLTISGRDDPANVLGFRQLKGGSATAKNGTTRNRNNLLAPITSSGTVGKLELLGNHT